MEYLRNKSLHLAQGVTQIQRTSPSILVEGERRAETAGFSSPPTETRILGLAICIVSSNTSLMIKQGGHVLIASIICFVASIAQDVDYDFIDREFQFPDADYIYDPSFPDVSVKSKIGEVSGVAALNSSHIYVFHRADRKWGLSDFDEKNVYTKQDQGPIKRPTIALLVDGKIQREFGEGLFFMPHSIHVDGAGNIWTTDTALHQVLKFDKADLSKPSLVLGKRFQPGKDGKHFCKPTDVKVASNGDFFVSDGYCNSRVLKFKPDGSLITYWGHQSGCENAFPHPGWSRHTRRVEECSVKAKLSTESDEYSSAESEEVGNYELSLPHALALNEKEDSVMVADRQNNRVVAFSAGLDGSECGKFLGEWRMLEPVYGVDYNEETDEIYALVGEESSSTVKVLDYTAPTLLQEIAGSRHGGFGMGHVISRLGGSAGFVVGSLVPKCGIKVPCYLKPVLATSPVAGGLFLYRRETLL
ncbi:hypothetical protein Ciccas_008530 [Cichlidogyrus casuarinus]|uniref:peptidylamidoglycolate lyase n=1 Tax=Cichlidogyrus casuarinus TaxID=1844966 RepID=A0ABD2Q0H7_9PLAT